MKSILHIYPSISGGGAEVVANTIAKHQTLHFKVIVATYFSSEQKIFEDVTFSTLEKKNGLLGLLSTIRQIKYKLKEFEPSAIISHLTYMNIASVLAIKMSGKKIKHIAVAHTPNPWRRGLPWRIIERYTYNNCICVCISNEVSSYLLEELGIKKTEILANPIEFTTSKNIKNLRKDGSDFQLIAIGRNVPVKNYPFLINAFSYLPDRFKLDIYGAEVDKNLSVMLDVLNLNKRITFQGFKDRKELMANLHNYDAFVMASDKEGEPLALLEAAANGVTIIGRNTPGLGKAIKKVGGFLLGEDEDEEAFSILIEEVVSSFKSNTVSIDTWKEQHNTQNASHLYCELLNE